jgi:adenosylcobinamide kinase / adenosylcobinamide-phosphate guanylyltransferase
VVGGAYSGKRNLIRERYENLIWHSAYRQDQLEHWHQNSKEQSILVLEGWEQWIQQTWLEKGEMDEVKAYFEAEICKICEIEKQTNIQVIFSMLEMGRGIVPMNKDDRAWRDLCGWILQYAARHADRVDYCWHGLAKSLK